MAVRNLVDAGPLVGWLNASDQWHRWSCRALSAVKGPLYTTEIVLGEACWHLGGNSRPAHALLSLVRRGAIGILTPWPEHLQRTQELMIKFKSMDTADASLVVLSEIYPRATIITTDLADFSVYRKNRNQPLPCIFPDS